MAPLKSFGGCDYTAHLLRCTDEESFCNAEPLNDIVWFRVDEQPQGEVVDLRPAQPVMILQLQDGLQKRWVVLLREL